MWSSWPVLTIIFHISKDCLCSACRKPYPLLVLLVGTSYGYLLCVWAWDTVSQGYVHVGVIHILPWWLWVRGGLIPSTLWASCCSPVFWINGSPSGTRGGTGRFLSSLFKAGSSLWYQFGCIFVALSRAVFTPNLNLWGADAGPIVAMIAKWTAERMVPLLWGRAGNEPSNLDIFFLLCSGGQCFSQIAKGNCERNTPRQ